jgi:hypothetical protein
MDMMGKPVFESYSRCAVGSRPSLYFGSASSFNAV